MANVIHIVNKQYRRSVNTTDYLSGGVHFDGGNWVVNPDISAVDDGNGNINVIPRYRIITGSVVTAMTPAEQDTEDNTAPRISAAKTSLGDMVNRKTDLLWDNATTRVAAETAEDEGFALKVQIGAATTKAQLLTIKATNDAR